MRCESGDERKRRELADSSQLIEWFDYWNWSNKMKKSSTSWSERKSFFFLLEFNILKSIRVNEHDAKAIQIS